MPGEKPQLPALPGALLLGGHEGEGARPRGAVTAPLRRALRRCGQFGASAACPQPFPPSHEVEGSGWGTGLGMKAERTHFKKLFECSRLHPYGGRARATPPALARVRVRASQAASGSPRLPHGSQALCHSLSKFLSLWRAVRAAVISESSWRLAAFPPHSVSAFSDVCGACPHTASR